MKIVNCGYNYIHPNDFRICRPKGSGDYMLLVLRSAAYFCFEDSEQITKSNSVIIFKKDTPQIYGAYGQNFINDWVHFEPDEKDIAWMLGLGLKFDTVIELPNVLPLSNIIQQLFTELYAENINADESSRLLLRLWMLKLSDYCNDIKQNRHSFWFDTISKLRADIFSDPKHPWNISQISKDLSISNSYLQHLYKAYFNRSIKEDITISRLEYAKYLLFSTDYTISTVSRQCGYQNDVHFMRVFKQRTGITPTEYRDRQICSRAKINESKNKNPYCL